METLKNYIAYLEEEGQKLSKSEERYSYSTYTEEISKFGINMLMVIIYNYDFEDYMIVTLMYIYVDFDGYKCFIVDTNTRGKRPIHHEYVLESLNDFTHIHLEDLVDISCDGIIYDVYEVKKVYPKFTFDTDLCIITQE
jgi:hypothetical protein